MTSLSEWGSQRDRDALDRHITGNYGEDQFKDMGKTTIDLMIPTAKKHSIRFDTEDDGQPVSSIYVARWWLMENGSPNGVRVTIEPIQ